MKSILISIKPKWVVKILNGEKTIEVRKKFPKDYVGWIYLYCSKNGKDLLIEKYSKKAIFVNHLHDTYGEKDILNGKVVARFWCDKVTEMIVGEDCCGDAEIEEGCDLIDQTCLTEIEIIKYLGGIGKNGYAIHISDLEIFDRPKELKHFYYCKTFHRSEPDEEGRKTFKALIQLSKAPQNMVYIEEE